MAGRLSTEIFGFRYQEDAGQVFLFMSSVLIIKESHMISQVQCFNS